MDSLSSPRASMNSQRGSFMLQRRSFLTHHRGTFVSHNRLGSLHKMSTGLWMSVQAQFIVEVANFLNQLSCFQGLELESIVEVLTQSGFGNPQPTDKKHNTIRKISFPRHAMVFREGSKVEPGVYFVFAGNCNIIKGLKLSPHQGKVDDMYSTEEGAYLRLLDSIKFTSLGVASSRDPIGEEGMLNLPTYRTTVRATTNLSLIYVPKEFFFGSGRFSAVGASLLTELQDRRTVMDRKYEDHRNSIINIAKERGLQTLAGKEQLRRVTDKGDGSIFASGHSDENHAFDFAKRYFRNGGLPVFSSGRCYRAGEVPSIERLSEDSLAMSYIPSSTYLLKRINPLYDTLPPASQLPHSRVNVLFNKLWENCLPETRKLLEGLHDVANMGDCALDEITQPSSNDAKKIEGHESVDSEQIDDDASLKPLVASEFLPLAMLGSPNRLVFSLDLSLLKRPSAFYPKESPLSERQGKASKCFESKKLVSARVADPSPRVCKASYSPRQPIDSASNTNPSTPQPPVTRRGFAGGCVPFHRKSLPAASSHITAAEDTQAVETRDFINVHYNITSVLPRSQPARLGIEIDDHCSSPTRTFTGLRYLRHGASLPVEYDPTPPRSAPSKLEHQLYTMGGRPRRRPETTQRVRLDSEFLQ